MAHTASVTASWEVLRRLATPIPGSSKFFTLYLNLDPSTFATPQARETEVNSLHGRAEALLKQTSGLAHEVAEDLKQDVEHAHQYLTTALDSTAARGLALFACRPAGVFEPVKLPMPVDSAAHVEDFPILRPAAETIPNGRWCVVAVNRRTARIFEGSPGGLSETSKEGFRLRSISRPK